MALLVNVIGVVRIGEPSGIAFITLRQKMMNYTFGLVLTPRGHHQLVLLILLSINLQELIFVGFTAIRAICFAVI